ncbi:MAG TPA: bifunctional transaldolase/phosoglucose isomerase [Micropepsaceae bacterium]|nr:bifunctional transaldolase/phosoglucose isomerase [Micropepsaceae bacterium]
MNPLKSLHDNGQSIWLDYLSRRLIVGGGLKKLIEEDGLAGITSNPSIFNKAIVGSSDYDESLHKAEEDGDCDVMTLYEHLAVEDIKNAADVLKPVFDATGGADGFVSLEVSPYIADDSEATVLEARRLWKAVDRENLMIKVPATAAGLPAIRQLLGEGININITLLFARAVYAQVAEAYLTGMEHYLAQGGHAQKLASVASFFVSRIDTATDKLIDEQLKKQPPGGESDALKGLRGKIAIANAKLAYEDYKRIFSGARWEKLRAQGARTQRLLWASTSTKNPAYPDTLYVEELIGPDTINTMPPETMDAYRDHGKPRPSLEENIAAAHHMLGTLAHFGISLDEVTTKLTADGVRLFSDAFDELLGGIERKRAAMLGPALNRQSSTLAADDQKRLKALMDDWRRERKVRRLWRKDASLWTGVDEAKWLGWLDIVEEEQKDLGRFEGLVTDAEKFSHAVLLGMGGSSLGAEVFATIFGDESAGIPLLVLDSTDPDQIRSVEEAIDVTKTLFIVSSKSGTTLEPNILKDYFFARVKERTGSEEATGRHFIAITDPGSTLALAIEESHFSRTLLGRPTIGGRYSVLSAFGLVPAALAGVDIGKLLSGTRKMTRACGADVPPADNPGVLLGLTLGALSQSGRDKLTIITSPGIADFGAWLEQLIAESLGKNGKGVIPLAGEPLASPAAYGQDRVFVYLKLESDKDAAQEQAIQVLEKSGAPTIRISIADRYQIGQEFFRWEMATAVIGGVIGVNPFDQPDVEAAKVKARELMNAYEKSGALPADKPLCEESGVKIFADETNARVLKQAGDGRGLTSSLKAHLERLHDGDYCALNAFIPRDERKEALLGDIRTEIRDSRHVATCVGFGPRFLHSTGQLHKGGPNSGVFLEITHEPQRSLKVPGRNYDFAAVLEAQARGDFSVLNERGRRTLRVQLGHDVEAGLRTLRDAVREALS